MDRLYREHPLGISDHGRRLHWFWGPVYLLAMLQLPCRCVSSAVSDEQILA